MARAKKEAPPEEAAGAPLWMVTFSDCMNLLLTFFVLLVTFSAFGEEQQERILNFGAAIRTVFGTPVEDGGQRDQSSVLPEHQVLGREQPEHGSDTPTGNTAPGATSGAMNEDLQAMDHRTHKVFLIPSRKVFLGRGRALSGDGRYLLAVMAAFLNETLGNVVISENGPEGPGGTMELGLSRAMLVLQHLLSVQDLDRQRFSIAAESITPPEGAGAAAVTYHRDERMLEVVLLEGSVPK
jgi:chemotaxis protein MotB